MGYRGEDVSAGPETGGRQAPWPSTPADQAASARNGFGYGPDGGYPDPGLPGYASPAYGEHLGYGQPDTRYDGPYGELQAHAPQSYGAEPGYGTPPAPPAYGQPGPQGYYDSPADGYGGAASYGPGDFGDPHGAASSGGYPRAGGGYGYPGGDTAYPGPGAGGYREPAAYPQENRYPGDGAAGYGAPGSAYSGGFPVGGYDQPGGYAQPADYPQPAGYAQPADYAQPDSYQQPGGYQPGGYGQPGSDPSGGYYGRHGGGDSAAYPALPDPGGYESGGYQSGGYQSDAYESGGYQSGAYQSSPPAGSEYGTGPRGRLRGDSDAPYPAGPWPGADPLATSVLPPYPGPQPVQRSAQQPNQYSGPQPTQGSGAPPMAFSGSPLTRPGAEPDPWDSYDGPEDYGTRAYSAAPGFDGYDGSPQAADGEYGTAYADDLASAEGDQYADRYGDDPPPAGPGERGRGRGGRGRGGGRDGGAPRRGRRLLTAGAAVVAALVIGAAAYVFLLRPSSSGASPAAQGPLPTASADSSQQACAKTLGTYCHIETRADDPTPLSSAEVYPVAFTNETDKVSYSLVSTKSDKTCSSAVIGSALAAKLKSGDCNQVLRASYVSAGNKIMGTIGVVNLATTNAAHYAGLVVGANDFIAPLTAAKGVAAKLGQGTGVVEARFKGHYLILTWSEFANEASPATKAQQAQLEQFGSDLVDGTANVILSQRMVSGMSSTASPSPGASSK